MPVEIGPYLQVRFAHLAGRLPSGELAYRSNITGSAQLWRIAPDGLHDQLTFGEERIASATPSPVDDLLVVATDVGGDERYALVRVDGRTGEATPLTDDPRAVHMPGAFSPDGQRYAFTHTGRNGADFDLATVAVDGEGRRELAQPGGYHEVLDWGDAGIVLGEARSNFDQDLYLVDPDTGACSHLTAHEGEASYAVARLLPGGEVLCITDQGSEFARLAELRDGEVTFLTPDDADVEELALDPLRQRRAWIVNREGWSELWVDGERMEGLPRGIYANLELGPDGAALTVAPPDDTADVWTAPSPRRRTRSTAGGVDRSTLVSPTLHTVASFDGRAIPYFLLGGRDRPTVCWVHGGPEGQFRAGAHPSPYNYPVIQYLCARGLAVAAPNVRGSTGYGRTYHHLDDVERRPDSVADLAAVAGALGAGSGTPVAVMGGSYGGYMTMAAITEYPDLWQAAVDTVGIVDFVTFLERTSDYRRALREAEYGSLAEHRELLERLSPIHRVDRIRAPLMVIHGANDPRVPVSQAEQIVEALQARGGEVEYLRYEDEGHGIQRLANRLDMWPKVSAFLERHLLA
jgi:dipeptidyl aminopeptidase/acylaminoacyl peptidase